VDKNVGLQKEIDELRKENTNLEVEKAALIGSKLVVPSHPKETFNRVLDVAKENNKLRSALRNYEELESGYKRMNKVYFNALCEAVEALENIKSYAVAPELVIDPEYKGGKGFLKLLKDVAEEALAKLKGVINEK